MWLSETVARDESAEDGSFASVRGKVVDTNVANLHDGSRIGRNGVRMGFEVESGVVVAGRNENFVGESKSCRELLRKWKMEDAAKL